MMLGLRRALGLTRRAVLAGLLLPAGTRAKAAAPRPLPMAREASRDALARVVSWGCQYQNVDLESIAGSDLDLIVLDPSLDDDRGHFITRADCQRLKRHADGSRRIVLGYLCVGELDTKRWYWPAARLVDAPSWVGPENPNWPGSRSVEYWNAEWQALVFAGTGSLLDHIVDAGFDGVFLDRVDAYGDWGLSADALDGMARLVVALAVKARRQDPGFILMMQNAEHILDHADLVEAIDAHSKESLLTGLSGPDTLNREEDVEWSLARLRPLQRMGIPTFATEYVSRPALAGEIGPRLVQLGFKPFVGTPALDVMPGSGAGSRN